MYSRREFGRMMLAGFPLSMALAKINSKFRGVQIGTITYSFRSMPANEIIPAMVKLGLSEAELMSNHCEALAGAPQPTGGGQRGGGRGQMTPEQQEAQRQLQEALRKWRMATSPDTFKAVKKKFNDAGIDVQILCFNQRMTATDDEIEYAFQMAKALGVRAISSSSTVSFAKRVAPFAEKHKIMWGGHGHSNVTDPEEFATPQSFATIMSFSKYIGVNLDIGHFTAANFDAVAYVKEHHARITNLHLKDRKKNQGPNVPWGQGDTPIKDVLQLMAKEKYTFPANIEFEYQVPEGSDLLTEMSKCVQYCKNTLAQRQSLTRPTEEKMHKDKITRRRFVAGTTGATLGAMIVPRNVLGGVGYQAPSDTVNVAVVGCGGQGAADATELVAGGQNIVALADVDFGFVDRAVARRTIGRDGQPNQNAIKLQEAYNKAKRYADFRKMLEAHKDVDGVVVATPDHTHAVVAKSAMELGKHVYVEKPMAWSVSECRVLRETAARTKVITQMGNQGHSSEGAALINEWIQAGIIGPVKEVHVWTNRPIWPQAIPRPSKAVIVADAPVEQPAGGSSINPAVRQSGTPGGPGGGGPGNGNNWNSRLVNQTLATAMLGDVSMPAGLDWDLFLGPGPEVTYHPIYHPFNWRGWVDWGTGAIGDMAAHLIDHPYWALGLKYPTSVEATSTPWGADIQNKPVSYPLSTQIVYKFPARSSQPPVTITWNDGGLMPPRPDLLPEDVPIDRGGGVIFIGEKGLLLHGTYGANPKLYPASLMEPAAKVPKTYPRVETNNEGPTPQAKHRMNWANAIKGKAKNTCPFEYAGRLTETMLLGVVAMRTGQGKRIYYDGEAGKITNVAEANQYLQREYRKGWSL